MPKNKVQQRTRAKRQMQKMERKRAQRMRTIRTIATVVIVVALALVLFFVFKSGGKKTAAISPGTASSSPCAKPAGKAEPGNVAASKTCYKSAPPMTIDPAKKYTAVIKTSLGTITVALDAKNAPITVNSFVFLAKAGFYDGIIFHRVIPKFMIQGGDPTGTGQSGPGYQFKNETHKTDSFDKPGILAMANAGPDTNGSQFYITVAPYPSLNGSYTIFGHVLTGQAVADKISILPGNKSNRPNNPPVIEHITIQVA